MAEADLIGRLTCITVDPARFGAKRKEIELRSLRGKRVLVTGGTCPERRLS